MIYTLKYNLWSYVCASCGLPINEAKTKSELVDIEKRELAKKPKLISRNDIQDSPKVVRELKVVKNG